ncbi:MAG: HD domain-containing protein [Candidatus Aenigmatarchaeota archaeon]
MKDLVDFLFEVGELKKESRSGWHRISVPDPESVAEHSFRATVVGYFLAREEGVDENEVVKMLLFHDVPETRIGDLEKVEMVYHGKDRAEDKAIEDQSKKIPGKYGEEYREILEGFNHGDSEEAIVARDADLIECAIQAKEYVKDGNEGAEFWIETIDGQLETETAKEMLGRIKDKEKRWWKDLF